MNHFSINPELTSQIKEYILLNSFTLYNISKAKHTLWALGSICL